MDRRQFFRQTGGHVARSTTEALREKIPVSWIRPPFAQDELDFLLNCTRCDDCANACPHDVIFPLNAKSFQPAKHTPGLNLLNKACKLCEGWPCVAVCQTGALRLPQESTALPKLNVVISVNQNHCLPYLGPECGACKSACPVPDALQWRDEKPRIDDDNCIGCTQCREACITTPKAIDIRLSV